MGDWDRAIAGYTQAIGLDPNDAATYASMGLAYAMKVDAARALTDW
jgi:tetratricopeptide (TPR) repeat protein